AEEAALLGRERGRLRGRLQPVAELLALLRRRLVDEQRVDGAQLVEDPCARVVAARLEAGQRVVAVLGLLGHVARGRTDELAVAAPPGPPEHRLYPPAGLPQ